MIDSESVDRRGLSSI